MGLRCTNFSRPFSRASAVRSRGLQQLVVGACVFALQFKVDKGPASAA